MAQIGLLEKKKQTRRGARGGEGGGEKIIFWEKPGIYRFLTFPLEFPGRTKLHPWKFRKTPGNSR